MDSETDIVLDDTNCFRFLRDSYREVASKRGYKTLVVLMNRADRDRAANLPTLTSVSPVSGKIDTTLTLTIQGTNLTGATAVTFIKPGDIHGQGKGKGRGEGNNTDDKITTSGIVVNAAGTQLTVSVRITSSADPGARIVRVETPNGETSLVQSTANTFTVNR
jgi:hypothetical protein